MELMTPVPHTIYGRHLMDDATIDQFLTACSIPPAIRGAQMPDGHVGYGLPIGGVLATRNDIIPYAIGVDISCGMRITLFKDPVDLIEIPLRQNPLRRALKEQTAFGVGAHFKGDQLRTHAVMDDDAWDHYLLKTLRPKALEQLGTSGTGNHFAEFGIVETDGIKELNVGKGSYLALLSHSGSRNLGYMIANHFTKIAIEKCELPDKAKNLAYLSLDSDDGQSYWDCMNLAGRYAAANHELIHKHIAEAAGLRPIAHIENHHNFAWLEEYDGEQLVVHRKGATPAGRGILGVIPGSMADWTYLVRGMGVEASLNSASHGAGRLLSRSQANKTLTVEDRKEQLEKWKVDLISAGIDESPQVYKNLDDVMDAQEDLIEKIGRFKPRIVMMAAGGRAED